MALTTSKFLLLIAFIYFYLPSAQAEVDDQVLAERARGAQAMSLQMMAADLLDELVYQWTQNPPLKEAKARVVLMRINAPIGLNSTLSVFLENHFFNLLSKNPQTGLVPVYCGPCLSLTSYSNSRRTVIARGADIPELGAELKEQADYALSIDLEAEGSQLVLRSYLNSLPDNRIIYAKGLNTDTGHPPALRQAYRLNSLEETRQEFIGILAGRKRLNLLVGIRTTIVEAASNQVVSAPFIWALIGVETFTNHRKEWLADLQLGVASIDSQYTAYQLSSRVYRHLFADTIDLTAPDLYASAGFTYWDISGPGAVLFRNKDQITPADIIAAEKQERSKGRAHNIGLILGIEARIAEMIRLGIFLERFSNQAENENFGSSYHTYGIEFGAVL